MNARIDTPLAALALRRGLPLPLVLAATALAVLLARTDWGASPALVVASGTPARAEALVRGLTRQGVFGALALVFAPFLVLRAAAGARAWRGPEAEWLGPRAAGRATVVLSTFLGLWTAAAAWVLGAGLIADRAAGAGPDAFRSRPAAAVPSAVLQQGGAARWRHLGADAPPGAIASLRVTTAPGSGAGTDVRLRATRGGRETSIERRVAGATRLELELPHGAGPLELELARLGPGPAVVVPRDAGRLLVPSASERLALLELGTRTWLALGAWVALALALGAWVSAPTAALGIAALWSVGWWRFGLPAWVPGHDLGNAASLVGEGFVPPSSGWPAWLGLGLVLAAGLGLAQASLRSWRRTG